MAEAIFEEFAQQYEITLIPSSGGVYEVTVGDELIYSKKQTGVHAEYDTDIAPHLRG